MIKQLERIKKNILRALRIIYKCETIEVATDRMATIKSELESKYTFFDAEKEEDMLHKLEGVDRQAFLEFATIKELVLSFIKADNKIRQELEDER